MRLLYWIIKVSGLMCTALAPSGSPVRGILAEITGEPGTSTVGEDSLPASGGPETLPLASVLLGMCVLIYALIRRWKRA